MKHIIAIETRIESEYDEIKLSKGIKEANKDYDKYENTRYIKISLVKEINDNENMEEKIAECLMKLFEEIYKVLPLDEEKMKIAFDIKYQEMKSI